MKKIGCEKCHPYFWKGLCCWYQSFQGSIIPLSIYVYWSNEWGAKAKATSSYRLGVLLCAFSFSPKRKKERKIEKSCTMLCSAKTTQTRSIFAAIGLPVFNWIMGDNYALFWINSCHQKIWNTFEYRSHVFMTFFQNRHYFISFVRDLSDFETVQVSIQPCFYSHWF